MATLIKQGKYWYVKYYDASKKQKWVKGYSSKSATDRLAIRLEDEKTRAMRDEIDPQQQQQLAERRRSIGEHLDAYNSHLQAGGRSKNHLAYTMGDIRAFVEHSAAETLSTITRSQMDDWVLSLVAEDEAFRKWEEGGRKGDKQGSPNSARTINRRVGSLQAILKWAHNSGAVGQYVLSKYPKREVRGNAIRVSRALLDVEVEKLLAWALKNAPARHDLYQFALLTGCRSDECAQMTPNKFDLKQQTVTVYSKDPRHSDRVDVVPMHPKITQMITRLSKGKGSTDRLFVVPEKAAEQLRADCKDAGIETPEVSFHGLRHSFITRLARMNVHPTICQKLARHRDLAMTLSYYTHWSTADEKAAIASI